MTISSRLDRTLAVATNLALLAAGILYFRYCRDGVVEYSHYIRGYSADVVRQIALYVAGALLVFFGRVNRWTLPLILSIAISSRIVGVFAPAFLSTDVYRYVWDGKVQAAGINPYLYIPADDHLRFLRDGQIYPHINRKEYAHTIYPPGAQLLFLGVTRISETEACMKAAMVGFEVLAWWAILQILPLWGRRKEEILLLAWSPLAMWEIGSSGHLDAVVVALLSLAALALVREKLARAACWIAVAATVKIYPGVLLLAFGRRLTIRMAALSAGIVAAGYAIYASAGLGVLGFLGGYSREEGLDTGDRYFPLAWAHRYLHAPSWPIVYLTVAALMLAGTVCLGLVRFREPKQILGLALAIALLATFLFSPRYPWYFLWILPLAVITRYLPAVVLTLETTYWFASEFAAPGPAMFRMNEYMYGIFLAAVAIDLMFRRFVHTSPGFAVTADRIPPRIGEAYD